MHKLLKLLDSHDSAGWALLACIVLVLWLRYN